MGRILLSICALVVAMGLGAAQQRPEGDQSAQQGQASSDQSAQVGTGTDPISQGERDADQDKADREANDIARRDLDAQQAMAWMAGLQILLTGIGIFFIRETLLETRRAVTEASNATEAANAAVIVQREVAAAQNRAWLDFGVTPEDVTLRTREGKTSILVSFKTRVINVGNSPAVGVRYGAKLFFAYDPRTFDLDAWVEKQSEMSEEVESEAVLPQGQVWYPDKLWLPGIELTPKGEIIPRLVVCLVYRTAGDAALRVSARAFTVAKKPANPRHQHDYLNEGDWALEDHSLLLTPMRRGFAT